MPNELEEFLKSTQKDNQPVDILEQPLDGLPPKDVIPAKEDEEPKNRAERRASTRRWERELQEKERDLIAREARAAAIAELQGKAAPSEVPVEWLQMYGDKPETREAWRLQEGIFEKRFESFRDQIKQDLVKEQETARMEDRQAEEELEDIIDSVEESYNVDLSSNSAAAKKARSQFLDSLLAVSPKDASGEVGAAYGDPNAAYELYELKRAQVAPSAQRNKDLASRSIAPSSEVSVSKTQDDAVKAYLRSEGINV